jgi:predicted amidophosphoribosyltransferase
MNIKEMNLRTYHGSSLSPDKDRRFKCAVCLKKAIVSSWLGGFCGKCGNITGEHAHHCARSMRRKMGFSRESLGKEMGYSAASILKYENTHCTGAYIAKLKKLAVLFANKG